MDASFNEAAALLPRIDDLPLFVPPTRASFNEAAALLPRIDPHAVAATHQLALLQ